MAALDGIRVLDFSRVFAGPAATQILGDLGADVIKVEEPGRGDEARTFGMTTDGMSALGVSASFLALNRNKRSLALDLGNEAGRTVARRLALTSDVVLHNFRPGTMERWKLGYLDLKADNPGLVFCTFSAYGTTGPLGRLGANDLALQGHSGLMSITGEADRPPVRCGTAVIDLHGSLAIVSSVLAALFQRTRTGEGQAIETSLLQSSAHLMNYFYTEYWLDGTIRAPMGTANHLSVPNQAFPAADGRVIIIAPSDEMWRRCAQALDPEALDRPDFATAFQRREKREEVVAALSAVTERLTCAELVDRLMAAKVNVAKVNSVGEAADDAQLAAIGGTLAFEYGGREVRAVAAPFAMSASPVEVRRPPPRVGEDRDAILDEAGVSAAERMQLAEAGAFGKTPR